MRKEDILGYSISLALYYHKETIRLA